jgi:hypothetical protein
LIQVVALLPLLLAVIALSTRLAHQALSAQRVALVHSSDQEQIHRILRCLAKDAAGATEARVERDGAGCALVLEYPNQVMSYRAERGDWETTVVLTDAGAERMRFVLRRATVEFSVEHVVGNGDRAGEIVWMRCVLAQRWSDAREQEWTLAGAAPVGNGGE